MTARRGTILVTGANGGLGHAIASQIISRADLTAYYGIFTARKSKAATALRTALNSSSFCDNDSFSTLPLDLSRLESVRDIAAIINERIDAGEIPAISAIILNAGTSEFGTQTWTEDGLDTSFMVNYLGHWLLTLLLLRNMDRNTGRIVWISSWAQNPEDKHNVLNGAFKDQRYKTIIGKDLEPLARGNWSSNKKDKTSWEAGYRRYGASKLCGVTMIHELQRRLDRDSALKNISVLAVDPGGMATGIVRQSAWFVRVLIFQIFLGLLARVLVRIYPNGTWRTPQKSAREILAAAFDYGPSPLTERPKSLYLNGSELGQYNVEAKDTQKGLTVWQGSCRLSQLQPHETILQDWQ